MTDKTQAMLIAEDILARVADLLSIYPAETAAALSLASTYAFAKIHPAKLTAANKKIIKQNYPLATEELMADRAMSELGMNLSISSSIIAAEIAMDYSPLSYVKDQFEADMAIPKERFAEAQNAVLKAYSEVRATGFSAFGTASMMIALAAVYAKKEGATKYQLMRPLLETAKNGLDEKLTAHSDDAAIEALSRQMGISRAAVKRMLNM